MLQIRLLGQFDTRLDGKRVMIPTRAAQSLLAYLVLTAGTPHRREKLAGIFWPENSEESARKNLRQELWRIRKATSMGQSAGNEYFLVDELTLTFNRDADYWLDVSQMERPELDLQSLIANLSLYQGELLPGFYDEWVSIERERVQAVFETRMAQLLEQLLRAERWLAVEEWAERWLALGGALERAYRALMLASGVRGDMAKVASLYQRCTQELLEQVGVEPSAETRALYDGLLKGARAPRTTAQPSGTVTFLFTDIEGSTRLLEKLGDQYAVVLSEHHEILRAAVRKWNGHEVDTQGDAFFVTFARAIDAIQCAAEAQRAITVHPWQPGAQLRVRMGLHTGEPLIASTGYVGMDVHRAARIGDAGHGGQVLLSQTTRDLTLHDLPGGLSIQHLGDHRLKDMKYPAPIYQLVIEGLPAEFPPLKTKFTGTEAPIPGAPPFKGLQYFEEEDTELFFGREFLTAKLVNRLRNARFLSVIIGASGSGKSSLVRAGLIPALKKGNVLPDGTKPPKGSSHWNIHVLTPTAHPLEALAAELTCDSESVTATATLFDDLMADPRSLSLFLARKYPKGHTLLVIDQFEELFTLCRDEFEREAFVDNLLNAIAPEDSRITLIMTLRADFYAHLSQYPELREAVARQQEYIGPMTVEELRRAIEEPARRGHWEFEPGLVDLILRDVGDEPGALPLLSHALLETWKRRAGHTLTLKGYADAGGVRGAIAHTAESVYQNLTEEEQVIARNIFLRLTELGEGTEDTRRRVSLQELMSQEEDPSSIRTALNMLADARLVTLSEDTAEVAHEALIREWPTLREWLNQDRQGLQLHRRLTEAARDWELLGRDEGALYRGAPLAQAREWAALHPNALNIEEHSFLNASLQQERHEQREREAQQQRELEAAQKLAETERARAEEQAHSATNLQKRSVYLSVALVIAIISIGVAVWFTIQLREQANIALARQLAAQAQWINATQNSKQLTAVLLAAQSMKMLPSTEGVQLLLGADLAARSITDVFHDAKVSVVAFSPDGKYVVSGSWDKTARIWEAATGKEIARMTHDDVVWAIAFSPDGKYVVSGSWDNTARVWDVATGKEIARMTHEDDLTSVAFSPDGKYVVSGSRDNTARVWEAATGKEIARMTHVNAVSSVAFSPDGRYVVSGSWDTTARVWEVATRKEVARMTHDNWVYAVAFSPNGKYIATASADKTARILEVATGNIVARMIHDDEVYSVAFSPSGKIVVSGSKDNTARTWKVPSGAEVRRVMHDSAVNTVAFSPDGKHIVSGSWDNTARVWEAATGKEIARMTHDDDVTSVKLSPDGKYIVSGSWDNTARIWEVATDRGHVPLAYDDITAVAFSPDGKYIVWGSWDRTALIWEAATGKELLHQIPHLGGVTSLGFSPDGKYVISGGHDHYARVWEATTGKVIIRITHDGDVSSVAFSPDGEYLVSGSWDNTARVWEAATGKEIARMTHDEDVYSVAFSPDGKYVVSGSVDKTARIWEAATGKEIARMSHDDLVTSVAFSPDGKYILSGSVDDAVRIWEAATGKEIARMTHDDDVSSVAFSPDGRYIVSGSWDNTARIWEVATRKEVARMIHDGTVYSAVFSPNGKYVVSASADNTARVWMWRAQDLIAQACEYLPRNLTHAEWNQFIGDLLPYQAVCPNLPIEPKIIQTPTMAE